MFLEKAPHNIEVAQIKEEIQKKEGILDVHHIHLWSIDGRKNFATLHVVTDSNQHIIKENVREMLYKYGIVHVTIECERSTEYCREKHCHL